MPFSARALRWPPQSPKRYCRDCELMEGKGGSAAAALVCADTGPVNMSSSTKLIARSLRLYAVTSAKRRRQLKVSRRRRILFPLRGLTPLGLDRFCIAIGQKHSRCQTPHEICRSQQSILADAYRDHL